MPDRPSNRHVTSPFGPPVPAYGEPVEVLPGILWLRLALPFALDHVNVWFLEDKGGWTLIDTGVNDERTRAIFDRLGSTILRGRSIRRLLVTHFHPDHIGLAGPIAAENEAPVWMTHAEWLTARWLALDTSDAFRATTLAHYRRCGMAPDFLERAATLGNAYRTRVAPPPPVVRILKHGDEVAIGGRSWRVVVGGGHAPEHVSLFCAAEEILIAGDQVLPRISTNVSVWASYPDADPLGDYLSSFERFAPLPAETRVLPSHDWPFLGLHARLAQLERHHEDRLGRLLTPPLDDATAFEVVGRLFPRPLDLRQLGFALGETLAHLNHAWRRRRAERRLDRDGLYRFST